MNARGVVFGVGVGAALLLGVCGTARAQSPEESIEQYEREKPPGQRAPTTASPTPRARRGSGPSAPSPSPASAGSARPAAWAGPVASPGPAASPGPVASPGPAASPGPV